MRRYPAVDRGRLGDKMIATLRQLPPQRIGMAARSVFYFRETAGVLAGALRERWKEVAGGDSTWLWFRTRRFTRRTEFRFPKATAVPRTIILAGVIWAIQTGEAIPARFIRCTRRGCRVSW
jgi:hypothetical protein